MPALSSSILAPDSNVTSPASKPRAQHLSPGIYSVALTAFAIYGLVRFAARTSCPPWPWLKREEKQQRRKDYGRKSLARHGGLARFAAGAEPPAQDSKHRQAIWTVDSAMTRSRGVSSNAADDISPDDPAAAEDGARCLSPPPAGPDGADTEDSAMDVLRWAEPRRPGSDAARTSLADASSPASGASDLSRPRLFMPRPPPPPPLTPPALSASVFTFDDRRPAYAASIPGDLETAPPLSFVHEPYPDHKTSSSSADAASSAAPKRRSYTKTLPVGIPTSGSSSEDTLATGKEGFAPSSFPSASPLLPPPPPSHYAHGAFEEGWEETREIDVHGEIMSVTDEAGAGWQRHTRVYGGGVCLACMAAGGGGFYGATVPPEHRR